MVGDFDGYRFVPESGVVSAYETCLPYAAQTFSGVSGRTVSMAWLRTENDKGGFRGIMSLPAELSLIKRDGSLRIRFKPVEELWRVFSKRREIISDGGRLKACPGGRSAVIML